MYVYSVVYVSRPLSTHLSTVRDVDDDVGLLLKESLMEGCKVRRVISVAAVRLDDGEGDGLARGEDNLATLIQLHEA